MSLGAALVLTVGLVTSPVPAERPSDTVDAAPVDSGPGQVIVSSDASPVPPRRPSGLGQNAKQALNNPPPAPTLGPSEMVCRDPRLRGNRRPMVVGHLNGCGIASPVSVTEISGIKLSAPALLNCRTARAFANWVTGVARPAATEILGRRLTKVTIYGSYSCRTRNSKPGAKLSEHAKGHAVDVAGVTLGDGRKISVLRDWGKGRAGQFLRRIWKQACGPFKTVIGPDGDRYHQDHLHLDTAIRHSSYCR